MEDLQAADSRFKSLASKFKEAVKPKGRPKKKSKQVSFNKTSLDRRVKTTKPKQKRKSMKRKDFIDDERDQESQDDLTGTKRARKPSKKVVPVDDEEGTLEEDLDSEDSFKPNEEEPSDDDEDSDHEVTFTKSSRKPNCDKCGRKILKFCELTHCPLCFEPLHEKCYMNGGCRRCICEDEFY